MEKKKLKPRIVAIYHDEHEEIASKCFEQYIKDKSSPELLLQASKEIIRSSNPEAQKMSTFYEALYLREKGIRERDDKKARKHLLKSLSEFKKVLGEDDDILKRIELEFLKRKLGKGIKPEPKLLFRRAKLFKELGQKDYYHLEMSLFYMFELLDKIKSLPREKIIEFAELMLQHAKASNNLGLQYKMESLYHQIRAKHVFSPKQILEEHQKAVEAIKMTEDKFGLESAETEAIMAKAMTTVDEKKRNVLLKKVAKSYQKRGLKKREEFVKKLIFPIPLRPAKIIFLCDKSIEKLKKLEKKILSLKPNKKPAAIFYHIGYLTERINDVNRIMMRMAITRKSLTHLQIKINAYTPKRARYGKPISKKLQKVFNKSDRLRNQMRQDMECLYIFGKLMLDQWSYVVGYIAGFEVPKKWGGKEDLDFRGLLNLLQEDYKGELKGFWSKHRKDITWLNFHLKLYRNIFVEHVRKPWQRGTTMASYGDDFNFHIPAPVGYVDEKTKRKVLKEIYPLAPQKLKDMPDDYWEKKNLHRVLEVTLFYIDQIEKQADRDKVWKAWQMLGGSAPSYDVIGSRLLSYIYTSIDTIMGFIENNPKLIKFGEFSKS